MASLYLLLLLPTLAFATIGVQVSGKFALDSQDLSVNFSGSETKVISDAEINTFQLSEKNLMRGVQNYFGKRPDDVFIKSPTPFGDLYKIYGWSQVKRSIKPLRGKILKITSKPEAMIQKTFNNNGWKPALFNVAMSQTVYNTIKSSWSSSERVSIENDIKYKFDFLVGGIDGRTTLSYTMAYGKDEKKYTPTIVGTTVPMELRLERRQTMMAELTATRGSVILEMEYEVSLSGAVAANYENKYRDGHFWALPIDSVMREAGLRSTFVNKQIVELEFYSDSGIAILGHEHRYVLIPRNR